MYGLLKSVYYDLVTFTFIAMFRVTSPIDINVPTRGLLAN